MRATLAVVFALCVSVPASAQGRVPRPSTAGPIAVTLPSPPPAAPAPVTWSPHSVDWLGWRLGWNTPVVVQQTQVVQPIQVAVPYYVPVPMRRRAEPAPPPVPYDPTKASLVMIGSGADGGAGVLRWSPVGADSIAVTWLGHARATREAKLLVADSLAAEVAARTTVAHRREVFSRKRAAFVGVAIVFADGARHTTLVPLDKP